jgi:hypothetical protein
VEPSVAIQLTGTFVKFVGETVAELKRAAVDLDLLRLKRGVLTERLKDLESEIQRAVEMEKGKVIGDLADRGHLNSSLKDSSIFGIERAANDQLAIAWREHNRAIEEIALMERRLAGGQWNVERGSVIILCVASAFLLCNAAFARRPYVDYETLRFLVAGSSVMLCVAAQRWNQNWALWLFGLLVLVFNPIIPLRLEREAWVFIDRVAAGAMLVAAVALKPGGSRLLHGIGAFSAVQSEPRKVPA